MSEPSEERKKNLEACRVARASSAAVLEACQAARNDAISRGVTDPDLDFYCAKFTKWVEEWDAEIELRMAPTPEAD